MKLSWVPKHECDRLRMVSPSAFATACRINTLHAIMRAGSGHIGSSFSAMDIMVWLHLEVLSKPPAGHAPSIYFSSKGHDAPGLYAVLTALGDLPFHKIHELRKLDGLPGHPDIGTAGIPCNTGSLGMGISKAKGMIRADRLNGIRRGIFVMTGDGELQEGQIWESLQGAANACMGELTVIVDHNKIQSDTWVEKVSPLGDLESKFRAFGWEVAAIDGHDFAAMDTILTHFDSISSRPKVLIANTTKGRGVSFMEETSAAGEFEFYKFHSGAPATSVFDDALLELIGEAKRLGGDALCIESETIPDRVPPVGQRLVSAYGEELVRQGARCPNLVVLDADLMVDCGLLPFAEAYPERFIECGIAEQDMVSQASGLALHGKLPIVHSFACFLTPRANEQIYNNATERTKIIYVGSLAGLVPGGPGHSHQSVRDIAILAQIPGLTLIEPACAADAAAALAWAVEGNCGSSYLRLTSIPVDVPFPASTQSLVLGRGNTLREGTAVAIIGYGPVLLTEAWHAAAALDALGIDVRLIDLPWLNSIDADWLVGALAGVTRVLTLDNHYRIGGQGDMIARTIAELGLACRITRLGLDDVPLCGLNPEVLAAHGLDRTAIVRTLSL